MTDALSFLAAAVPSPDDPGSLLAALYAAATAKRWLVLGALVVFTLVAVARRKHGWLVQKLPILGTDRGGAVLVLLLSFVAEVATAVITGEVTGAGALVGALAAGGRAVLKGLATPAKAAAPPPLPKT